MSRLGLSNPTGTSSAFFPVIYPGTSQTVAVGAASAASSAFAATTTVIRVVVTADSFIAIGQTPVAASATGAFLPNGTIEYFAVNAGDKIAVIQASTGGNLYVTEGT